MQNEFSSRVPVFLSLGFPEAQLKALRAYVDLLWSANEELNLVSRKLTAQDLIDNHIIDSMLPLQHFPKDAKVVADFGTGGGLPAIIFALFKPEAKFQLYEKSPLKQKFLEKCKAIAPNIQIGAEVPIKLPGVDLVTCRGFKPIDVILQVSRDYYQNGGKYFLLKARHEKIEEELQLARKQVKQIDVQVIALKSPVLDVERHIVQLHKPV